MHPIPESVIKSSLKNIGHQPITKINVFPLNKDSLTKKEVTLLEYFIRDRDIENNWAQQNLIRR